MSILVWSDDDAAQDVTTCGEKFASLARVARWPLMDRPELCDAAVLSTHAWHLVVERAGLTDLVSSAGSGDEAAARELCAALAGVELPDEVVAAATAALDRLLPPGGEGLAVRSSAVAEDQEGRSFAGQYATALGVADLDGVLDAYRACLASAWRPGVQAYRAATSTRPDRPEMAVILQPMVHAGDGWAGAAVSDGRGGVIVEAVRGLGAELMSGRADPLRWSAAAGEQPDGVLARAVVAWVRIAERRVGRPLEVEFALPSGASRPVVLQLRPYRPAAHEPTTADRWQRPSGDVNGLAVGSGSVRGIVCRLDGPHQAERLVPGGVLVTAATDPGWLPLLAGLGAVVTDHGGLTSHAAIVCRELGILAVVGCGDATRRLRHGAHVEVRCDGARGSVSAAAS